MATSGRQLRDSALQVNWNGCASVSGLARRWRERTFEGLGFIMSVRATFRQAAIHPGSGRKSATQAEASRATSLTTGASCTPGLADRWISAGEARLQEN